MDVDGVSSAARNPQTAAEGVTANRKKWHYAKIFVIFLK
jgi:hypothetical protein